jgi:hypothetical protein
MPVATSRSTSPLTIASGGRLFLAGPTSQAAMPATIVSWSSIIATSNPDESAPPVHRNPTLPKFHVPEMAR